MGSSLAPADIRASTRTLDEYFSLLCSQAGLSSSDDVGAGCRMPAVDTGAWTAVVLQGMNDIDRRCDAYLEWLDDKRRSRAPLISQINDVGTATTAIIGFADRDATKAISIVGQVFGLITRSVENYHSRLLLEIESSTVNSIVIQERFRFRHETQNLTYGSRPAAEYALRSYTRICLPFAIETQINDLSTLGSRREMPTSETSIHQSPAVAPIFGTSGLAAAGRVNIDPRGARAESAGNGWSDISDVRIDVATAKTIQKALCLTGSDVDGAYGTKTEVGLKIFKSISSTGGITDREWRSRTVNLSQPEVNELQTGCVAGAKNYLEHRLLSTNPTQLEQLVKAIREKASISDGRMTLNELRPEIVRLRESFKLDNGPRQVLADQVTPDFVTVILAPLN